MELSLCTIMLVFSVNSVKDEINCPANHSNEINRYLLLEIKSYSQTFVNFCEWKQWGHVEAAWPQTILEQ